MRLSECVLMFYNLTKFDLFHEDFGALLEFRSFWL